MPDPPFTEADLRRIVREEIRAELAPVLRALGALGRRKEIAQLAAAERAERKRQDERGAAMLRRYYERQKARQRAEKIERAFQEAAAKYDAKQYRRRSAGIRRKARKR